MVANTANLALLSTSEIDAALPTPEPTLTTNFNVTPYFDDFDENKDYYRILFKPGFAVQARELTQIQTILQQQIDRFGKHIFKEGSIVLPGEFIIETDVDYVKIRDVDTTNNSVVINNYIDQTLISANSGVQAYVINVEDGSESSSNTKTLYVRYLNSSNTNSAIKTFQTNDVLNCNVGNILVYNTANNIGQGSRFVIREGVYFAKQHFIKFPTQSVILSRYSTSPTCRVGFQLVESIVDSSVDNSLLDPALESSNYSAPGADRLKLASILTVKDYNDTEGAPDFVELFKIKDGIVTELWERPEYNILGDELAKRTLDESGDYYVRGLSVRLRENLDVNNNGGLYENGDENKLSAGVEPGMGYVKGYPVELYTTKYVDVNKSTAFNNVSSQTLSSTMGNYLIANNFIGNLTQDIGSTVLLKDVAAKRIANKVWASAPAVSGNTIGTAKLRSIEYNSGTLGTTDGTVAIYLTDIKMNGTNSFVSVKSVTTSANTFGADPVLENGFASLKDSAVDVLLYYTGTKATKTTRDTSGNPSVDFNFKKTTSHTMSGGTFSISGLSSPEEFPYGSTTLSSIDKREIILTVDSDLSISGTGTVTSSANVVTAGTSGAFSNLNVGDKLQFSSNVGYPWTVLSVDSGTQVTLKESTGPAASGATWAKVYKSGDVIDLTTKGYTSGTERSVTATSSTLSFNLGESISDTCKVSYPVNRSTGQEVAKILKSNAHVGIVTSNSSFGTTGPFPLGVSDVYQIRSIINVGTGANVTSSFILDNGQRDSFYDHATITPVSGTFSGELRVNFDYFEPDYSTGKGYFSIDSYPINDTGTFDPATDIKTENVLVYKSPRTGLRYDLRNHLDFRPVKDATATYSTSSTSYNVNPSTTAAFDYDGTGLRMPVPSSQITFDYSYYLPRRDIVVIDKNKDVFVIEGVAGVNPRTPVTPDDVMLLSSIYVSEYPSLATNYAKQIGREDLSSIAERQSNIRFTMRDIGILKRRIENLEYYSSLNLLQKSALDMNIVDDNGNNRFKNGIFVDNFVSHLFGQTDSPDYRIVVDRQEKSIRPMYTAHSFYYEYLSGESSNIQQTGNLLTLEYTEELLLEQPAVTSYRNVELSSYRFVGSMTLDPDIDVWVDTNTLPDEQIRVGPTAANLPQNTVEYNLERQINGYIVGATVGGPGTNGKVGNYGRGGTGTTIPKDFFGRTTLFQAGQGGFTPAGNDQPVYSIQNITETTTTTSYTLQEEVTNEGSKIVDVGLVPYIRPQIIDIWGRGLKRDTEVYLFFDGEDMSSYAAPMTQAQFQMTPDERRLANFVPAYGDPLIVDANGNVYVALELPTTGKQFRVGQKEVVLTDSPTNSIDATTYSKGYFVASGITKSIQGKVLTTATITSSVDVDVSQRNENVFLGYLDNPSCTAYSFLVKAPPEDEGLFLTSVDLFFARKHPTLGVWVEIRAMDNAGGITRTQVPYSEVWKTADEITISTDGYTNATNFAFPSPVFLYNNVEYAFVIHTEGLNPDTYLWISRLGETDVRPEALGGGGKHNSRPLTGTFFTTNNNLNWNIVDDIDLKIKFYRASFNTGVTATAVLGNEPVEKLLVDNSSRFTDYSEPIVSYYRLSLTGNTASVSVGDYLIGANTGANSTVIALNGSVATVANTSYVSGERVDIAYSSNAISKGVTSVISSLSYGNSVLGGYNVYRGNTEIDLIGSNGQFKENEYITGVYSGHSANVVSIQNYRYSKVSFEPTYLKFKRNSLSFDMKTTSNTGVAGSYFPIYESDGYFFNTEQALYSRSNEITDLSSDRSNKVKFTFSSSTSYLSPVIDVSKTRSVYVDNLINANTTYPLEASTSGGELLNKYISRIVTLAEGQDAEDLNVYITAYRPPNTDVLVWCKILNKEDSDTMDTATWIQMESTGAEIYSSLSDSDDFKEIKYVIPESYLTGPATDNSPGGEVQYTNSQGVTFTGYKYFAIKIGLAGTNSAIVPRVLDLRCVALQI